MPLQVTRTAKLEPQETTAAATHVAAAAVVSNVAQMGGGGRQPGRSLIERFDFASCFSVTNAGGSWVIRCRLCAAGWIPTKDAGGDASRARDLLEHARAKHGLHLHRRPRVSKSIERRIVVRIDGRVIKSITNRISAARAKRDRDGSVSVECTYSPAPDLRPAAPPPAADKGVRWSAAVERWRRTL